MGDDVVREHAGVVQQLRTLAEVVSPRDIGRSFVASLSSRELATRSALGSYAFARVLPDHPLDPVQGAFATICRTCGWSRMPTGYESLEEETARHLPVERSRYGGLRHLDPHYALFDLTEWRALSPLAPTREDERCLDLLLRTPALLSPNAKAADLEHALRSVLPSNKVERQTLIRILGYAGVFEVPDHPSFFDGYVLPDARELPRQRFADWGYPIIWWRAIHGVRRDAADFWFA